MTTMTGDRHSKQVVRRLDNLARKTRISRSFYLRELGFCSIDDLEDYYLAADVLKRVRIGKERILTQAELRQHLGLDD